MSKYYSRKAAFGKYVFDSRKERDYYVTLLAQQRIGEIKSIELQPVFELQPGFTKNGKRYRPITYRADFRVRYKDGHEAIIDVKGYKTKVFRLKQKLFEYKFPGKELIIV